MILTKLDNYIKETGLKKKKVAEKLGVTPQHLSSVLSGKYELSSKLENDIRLLLK